MNFVMIEANEKRKAAEERSLMLQGIYEKEKKEKESLNLQILEEKSRCD